MHEIDLSQFANLIKKHSSELRKLIDHDLPIIVGREAVTHFKLNFQNEGWGRTKWPEVKRRQNSWTRGAARTRKILTGKTGDLGRSIQYTPESGKVTIHSDLIYAAVHNFGLRAGRGKGFQMPQRKFVGESEQLNEKIKTIIETKLNNILNQ